MTSPARRDNTQVVFDALEVTLESASIPCLFLDGC